MVSRIYLGANSPTGFYSYFDWLIDLETAQNVWILKGGPGCGKSTFMRHVAAKVEAAGHPVIYVACSSDPDSLDGAIFPTLHAALVDGTPPHIVEPKYPAVVERYVNLGVYYDVDAIREKRAEGLALYREYRSYYPRVTSCLEAARVLQDDLRVSVSDRASREKIQRRVRGIIRREMHPGQGLSLRKCFLSAVTPQGVRQEFETVRAQCSRVYELQDNFGQAHDMLSAILQAAIQARQDILVGYDPMGPAGRLEHILLPALDLAFVTSTDERPYDGERYRRVRLDACLPPETLKAKRGWLRFLRKTVDSLTQDAVRSLKAAKDCHDRLEALLNPHVDFEGVLQEADKVAAELLLKAGD